MQIKPGVYTHYKGSNYEIIVTATHSETNEEMVVYRALDNDNKVWVCPAVIMDELVEFNGKQVKHFVHNDELITKTIAGITKPIDTSAEPDTGIHKRSPPGEKVALFLSMFTGRDDVYAKRWGDDKKSGYTPACRNEWKPNCKKRAER